MVIEYHSFNHANTRQLLTTIWNTITNFGVSEHRLQENELVRSYNIMSLLSASGTFLVLLIAWSINFPNTYIYIVGCVTFLYIGVLIANYFNKIILARYLISLCSPLWISGCNILIGGYYCQGLGILASMAISYIAFQKQPRTIFALIIFHLLLFFSSIVYVNTFGPVFGVIDFPYDEITVFMGSLGWTIILLYRFDKDRMKMMQNLKKNNQELQDTTEELERFTYIASHDLKSPLRTIISFIGLIERDIKRERFTSIQKNLSFVKSGAEQMNFLVKDILEVSKIKNQEKAKRSLIDLNLVFEKAKLNLNEEIREKSAIVHCEQLPEFFGNETEFLLIFQNFIQNGIKYNESQQPTIFVSSTQTKDTLSLSFKDNGIGIEKQYHQQIFQFFKRLHNSTHYQGTGLGLGLCKKIITNYHGDVVIDSKMSQGTTFTILLPLVNHKKEMIAQEEIEAVEHF